MSLLVVGTVAFDKIETPFGQTDKILGGAGTYVALSASILGEKPQLISVIGSDFPQSYLDMLTAHHIDASGIELKPNGKTFFWHGRYHMDMNRRDTIETQLNVLADFEPKVLPQHKNPKVLVLGNLHPLVQLSVLEQIESKPLVILDTMDFWMDVALEDLKKIIAKTNVLCINDEEARQLSGEYSLVKAASKIMDMGPDYLIIKKGEHGALLFHGHHVFFAPALPLEDVFDPTGAGDTFAGGFAGYLSKTNNFSFENMKRAIIYGSALASFCVERFGTERLETLSHEKLEERLEVFKTLTQFEIDF